MWKFVAPVALAALTFQTNAAEPAQSKAAIRAKMSELAGTAAVNCGLLERGDPLASSWRCAQAADGAKKPFWLALEASRTDSAVWLAVARGPDGKRYAIFYTSNEYGQMDFNPHFTVTVCNEPFQLFEDSRFILRCGPEVP